MIRALVPDAQCQPERSEGAQLLILPGHAAPCENPFEQSAAQAQNPIDAIAPRKYPVLQSLPRALQFTFARVYKGKGSRMASHASFFKCAVTKMAPFALITPLESAFRPKHRVIPAFLSPLDSALTGNVRRKSHGMSTYSNPGGGGKVRCLVPSLGVRRILTYASASRLNPIGIGCVARHRLAYTPQP